MKYIPIIRSLLARPTREDAPDLASSPSFAKGWKLGQKQLRLKVMRTIIAPSDCSGGRGQFSHRLASSTANRGSLLVSGRETLTTIPTSSLKNTNTKAQISKYLNIPLLASAMALCVQTSSAGILLSDDFSAGTIGLQPGGWFANAEDVGGVPALVVTDDTVPLSGNALEHYGPSSATVMVKSFATTTLAVAGDSITLTVDMHSPTAGSTAPFIGLYNDMGTPLTANVIGATGDEGDDTGFAIHKQLNADLADFRIFERSAQGVPNSYGPSLLDGDSGIIASSTEGYTMTLTLTRNAADGLDITAGFGSYSTTFTQATPITFTFNEVFLINGLLNGGAYRSDNVLVTTTVGTAAGVPVITNQPAQTTASLGATATFTVGVSNSVGASYQWQFYGTNISDGGNRSGATTGTLRVSGVSTNDVGHYRVFVTNGTGGVTSADAALAIVGLNFYPVVSINGKNGDTYRVEYATALAPSIWIPLSTNVLGTSKKLVVDDSSPGSNTRFYRTVYLAR